MAHFDHRGSGIALNEQQIEEAIRGIAVVREAVGDRAKAPHDANLFDIAQKYGDVISVDDAVAYLSEVPAHQEDVR